MFTVRKFLDAISRSRAAQNLSYQEFKLFEHPKGHKLREFLNSRQIRAEQGIRLWRTSERLPFWFVLGKQNEHKKIK